MYNNKTKISLRFIQFLYVCVLASLAVSSKVFDRIK